MNEILQTPWPWLVVINLPLLAALLLAWRATRPTGMALAPWTALPALGLAIAAEPGPFMPVPWLLLGAQVGLGPTGRVFLLFSSALWFVAGLYARAYLANDPARTRFFACFLITMTGNLGLILAGDLATFYLFFALMSFASYGLIIHNGDAVARQAGRVYIILVVLGEILLFVGILIAAHLNGNDDLDSLPAALAREPAGILVVILLLIGFGIKAGAIPLHVWLPLAHPAAPTPASAVLSGAMIKAGLLGWLRFLPLGEMALPEWGIVCVAAGLGAAFLGVLVGIMQDNPKVALAYSSISQIGLMTVGLGSGLAWPEYWDMILPALWVYALHHALAKGALFLGVGVAAAPGTGFWQRQIIAVGLLLPALSLAGVPFTSGAVAKIALKKAGEPLAWAGWLDFLFSLAAVGTTLLMARFLFLVWPRVREGGKPPAYNLWPSWLLLVGGAAVTVWVLPVAGLAQLGPLEAAQDYLWATLWPPVLGTILALTMFIPPLNRSLGPFARLRIPPGDLLWPVVWLLQRLRQFWNERIYPPLAHWFPSFLAGVKHQVSRIHLQGPLTRLEEALERWEIAGLVFLALVVVLFVLLILPGG